MKKYAFIISALFAVAFTSCNKEEVTNEPVNETGKGQTITFVAENPDITKTVYDGTNKVFKWKTGNPNGDWVKFHLDGNSWGDNLPEAPDGNGWKHVRNSAEKDGDRAKFTLSGVNGTNITAVYPTTGIEYVSFGSITGSIGQDQTVGADHVESLFPLMAVANNISSNNVNNLVFRNIATLVKFELDDSFEESDTYGVYQVTLAVNSASKGYVKFVGSYSAAVDEGTGVMTVTNTAPTGTGNENNGTYINLNPNGSYFTSGEAYYFKVLPATLDKGFDIYVKRRNKSTNVENEIHLEATKPVTFAQNRITNLGTLTKTTVSSEFKFTEASRDITAATNGQLDVFNITNPKGGDYTAKLEYFENDVLKSATEFVGPTYNAATCSVANGAEIYFEGENCTSKQIYLRLVPANQSLKVRKYKITIKRTSDDAEASVTVTQAAGEGYPFSISKAESTGRNYLSANASYAANTLYTAITTDASVSWTLTVSYLDSGSAEPVIVQIDSKNSVSGSGNSGDKIYAMPVNANATDRTWTITAVTTSDDVALENRTKVVNFTQVGQRTITVGVISYVYNEANDGYILHYWGGCAGEKDVDLTTLGTTESDKELGDSYWSNEGQTFYMFSAVVDNDITGFQVWHPWSPDNRWFGSTADASTKSKAYIFNYSGDQAIYE